MSLFEVVAIVFAVVCGILLVLGVWGLVSTLRYLRRSIDELRSENQALANELRTTVDKASGELERVDEVVDRAERVVATADVTARLAQRVATPVLVKVLAVGKGISRATLILTTRKTIPDRSQKGGSTRGKFNGWRNQDSRRR